MMPNLNIFYAFALLFILNGCRKPVSSDTPIEEGSIEKMKVSPDFIFKTVNDINVRVTTLDNSDKAVPRIRVNLYTDFPEKKGSLLVSFFTGENGVHSSTLKVPSYYDSLVVQTDAIGFVGYQKIKIVSNNLNCVLGGKKPILNGRMRQPEGNTSTPNLISRLNGTPFVQSLGAFNSLGVPSSLINPNDIIDASVVADLNAALPEHKSVPVNHPTYMSESNQSNLEFTQSSKVWVTFLHEGASFRNVLCYYRYSINNPPATSADIDTIFAVFPNVKYINNGGGLVSGNKIQLPLGAFQPGTAIGFVLVTDGFENGSIVSGTEMFYSNSNFNPEADASLKKHSLLLKDVVRNNFVLSFEDTRRDGKCDDDFNDAIFFINIDPVQSINSSSFPAVNYFITDTDNDGIADNMDDYPNDPSKALNTYYPSQNIVGTLAFEDLWPSKGDYDFNDMVIDYNFIQVTNGQNQVVQIKAAITLKAIGASYHSGFGIQLPINANEVASVTGNDVRSSLVVKNPNGTEAGQSKATIIVFDDAFDQLPWPGGNAIGVNTTVGAPYVQPKTLTVVINLLTPISQSIFQPPYNPFIFIDKTRSKEVHLINKPPTDLADRSLLGTANDNSNVGIGRYYVTADNLPFAIDIAGPFDYSTEKKKVTQAHLKFYYWGVSSGVQYKDWYKPMTNYRNNSNIFSH